MHSKEFKHASDFKGRSVLVVGSSYSAEDITSQLWKFGTGLVTIGMCVCVCCISISNKNNRQAPVYVYHTTVVYRSNPVPFTFPRSVEQKQVRDPPNAQ
jgi:hypothetical protein